jgi:PHS family inorganic phosphate transporter-like MFS transporter
MLALAALYEHWTSHVAGFMALYNVAFFFANAGPNTTTFVAPAELFPARLRCTCHGIAAASGRAGAVLGAFGFFPKKGADGEYAAGIGTRNELFVLAGTNFLGMLMTLFVPETRAKSLEVLSKEVIYEAVDDAACS